LERTFFFEVDRRRVNERTDLREILRARQQCESFSPPVIVWDFAEGVHGWEAWNDLERFEIRDGALTTRALGNDPFMASPEFVIPALALGDIEIEVRVRAAQSNVHARVFWLATDQPDFQPGLSASFAARADGDHITRLRFDPADVPGEIAIKTIRVFAHCSTDARDRCACPR
jgi:hypothetical protein